MKRNNRFLSGLIATATMMSSLVVPGGMVFATETELVKDSCDANFWAAISVYDLDSSDSLDAEELGKVEVLKLGEKEISSLIGIEYFTNLKYLVCSGNKLQELDLSALTNLEVLSCEHNALTSLKLNSEALYAVTCYDNKLTELDLSGVPNAKVVLCDKNDITTIDLAGTQFSDKCEYEAPTAHEDEANGVTVYEISSTGKAYHYAETGAKFGFEALSADSDVTFTNGLEMFPAAEVKDPTTTPEVTNEPTTEPTAEPTEEPTGEPTAEPTEDPEVTTEPTIEPTETPTTEPTAEPTEDPTTEPTEEPTAEPTESTEPTTAPEVTDEPTEVPTNTPATTEEPEAKPTEDATVTDKPEDKPSSEVTATPEPTYTPEELEAMKAAGLAGFAERLYTTCLGRESEKEGKEFWINELKNGRSGADVALGFFFSPEFLDLKLSDKDYVTRLYATFMNRTPDEDGLNFWLGELKGGKDRKFVFDGFVNSREWGTICYSYGIVFGGVIAPTFDDVSNDIKDFAKRLYTTCLGRSAEKAGLEYWAFELANMRKSGTTAAMGFFFSPEFEGLKLDNDEYVTRLYRTFMGREPEKEGFDFWVSELEGGKTRMDVFAGFSVAPEFAKLCDKAGIIR